MDTRDGSMPHLTEGEDERDGDEDGAEGRDERVQKYRQRLHGEGVADEEGAEEQVLVLDDRQDPGGVVLVRRGAGLGEDLEVDEAERHEAEGEPRHEPGEHHQPHARHQVHPEHRPAAHRMLRHLPPAAAAGESSSATTELRCSVRHECVCCGRGGPVNRSLSF
jgi:hypothetical protein